MPCQQPKYETPTPRTTSSASRLPHRKVPLRPAAAASAFTDGSHAYARADRASPAVADATHPNTVPAAPARPRRGPPPAAHDTRGGAAALAKRVTPPHGPPTPVTRADRRASAVRHPLRGCWQHPPAAGRHARQPFGRRHASGGGRGGRQRPPPARGHSRAAVGGGRLAGGQSGEQLLPHGSNHGVDRGAVEADERDAAANILNKHMPGRGGRRHGD